jgi:hypothetical protein
VITFNVIERVFNIEFKDVRGTAFKADVDGRKYWITAKHILEGFADNDQIAMRFKNEGLRVMHDLLVTRSEKWTYPFLH